MNNTEATHKFVLLFLVPFLLFFSQGKLLANDDVVKKKKTVNVMIDPGHGGEDDGAAFNGYKEKVITLQVARELKHLLEKDSRFEISLTRDSDIYVPLDNRKEMASSRHADIFISIHVNSSPETKAKGVEFYFENQVATDEESLLLANKENNVKGGGPDLAASNKNDLSNILTDLAHNDHMILSEQLSQNLLESFQHELHVKTRAIRQAPFRALSATVPATLVELGFISNPQEAKMLAQNAFQKDMAKALYDGLKQFKEKLDKARNATVK